MNESYGPPAVARTRILDAAETIAAERGAQALTLEAAARLARVSKGGLLYHFPSKEALLRAMVGRLAAEMHAAFDAALATTPPGTGRAARAMLRWMLGDHPQRRERDLRIASVLLAAFYHDPALLDPVRALQERLRAMQRADGLAPGRAAVIAAALDGVFTMDMLRLRGPDEAGLRVLAAELEGLASEGDPAPPSAAPAPATGRAPPAP